eukprot:CAMPEP_0196657094 /NCGR_PEP_ID=MMETSP1086-20130531/21760_1 /TAXON_ID=77921 /ORGANISM="Cyanoptyche  gloeocystis , Strain SAG4.97" /LENGTH=255 /DNA_ID=CAMNT_0041990107 /DNA_START=33 /DNA_END=800 /DNA_ORIENTATION=+
MILPRSCVFVILVSFFSLVHAEEERVPEFVEDGNLHKFMSSEDSVFDEVPIVLEEKVSVRLQDTEQHDAEHTDQNAFPQPQEESEISSAIPAPADISPVNHPAAGHYSSQFPGFNVVPVGPEISHLNEEKAKVQEELRRAREKLEQLEQDRQRLEDEKKRLLKESAERSVQQMYIERVGENKAAEEKAADSQNPAGRKLKESGESQGNEPKPFVFEKRRPKPADPEIVRPGGYWQAIRHSKYAHTFQMPGEQRRQ